MNAPVYDHQQEVKLFVERGLWNNKRQFGNCYCIGFANENDGLVAGVVYHNFDPDTQVIELSSYSSRRDWANKKTVKLIFGYPFDTWGVRLLVARHSERNNRVRRIWKRIGATEHLIPELRGEGEAEIIATLTRNSWEKSKFNYG